MMIFTRSNGAVTVLATAPATAPQNNRFVTNPNEFEVDDADVFFFSTPMSALLLLLEDVTADDDGDDDDDDCVVLATSDPSGIS